MSRRSTGPALWACLVLPLAVAACGGPSIEGTIPNPAETQSVSIIVYNLYGTEVVGRRVVEDEPTIREIYGRLTPYELSEFAEGQMRWGFVIGKLGITGPKGTTWVEFVDAGQNPLCFRAKGRSFHRGGANYHGYRADHKRLDGLDTAHVDEGKMFYEKLLKICDAWRAKGTY